ncbi:MAG: S8 family serine peptidase [Chlorobi bacterium]|nr:S8 family serine peptidase [Chlorobiota bacterium]
MKNLVILLFTLTFTSQFAWTGTGPRSSNGTTTSYLDRLPADAQFVPHTVIVKFRESERKHLTRHSVGVASIAPVFTEYGVYTAEQMYPNHRPVLSKAGREVDLSRMYRLEYSSDADPITVAKALSAYPEIEYAEPEQIHHVVYTPTDPKAAQQYHLKQIKAYEAWDITKGSKDIVIGIVDTGVDWKHKDLRANIWINPGEDVNNDGKLTLADYNNVDDDGNGFVDDIIGIDFIGPDQFQGSKYYDNDPQPTATGNPHGTHVAGIAAAVGENSIGVVGVAYKCKILPIKCGDDKGTRSIRRGYEGIVYAADMGAKIINCSWGGGGYLQSEYDQVEYATAKGSLVVAAAGNDNSEKFSSPAAYPQILAVSNVTSNDVKNGSSNYGTWVDVAAPGTRILSTVSRPANGYQSAGWSGTSMASPVAAGVAALVLAKNPNMTPLQVAMQVRVTSDNIDGKNAARFKRKLGYGRVNAYRALTEQSPAVRLSSHAISDSKTGNGNGIIDPGEDIAVTMKFKNYLAPTTNAIVTLTTTSNYVEIVDGTFILGTMGTGDEKENGANPFVIRIKQNIPLNEEINLITEIKDGSYSDYDGFTIIAQPTYRDHTANEILTTLSNDGNIGFDDFSGMRGRGFIFQNNGYNVLFEGGLMLGAMVNGDVRVVDVVRNEAGSVQNADFGSNKPLTMTTPGPVAAQEGTATWTDQRANARDRLGVQVHLNSYEFTDPGTTNILILRYDIKNTSGVTLENFHAGLFFDWDIGTSAYTDYANIDTDLMMGYALDNSKEVPTHVGVMVLTRDKPTHYTAINNPDPDDNGRFGIHNGFTKEEKWASMSSGILQRSTQETDISQVIGNGPYTLKPGESVTIAFAVLAGLSVKELKESVPTALTLWDKITKPTAVDHPGVSRFALSESFPNPFGASSISGQRTATVSFSAAATSPVRLDVVDEYGRAVTTLFDDIAPPGNHVVQWTPQNVPSGIYFLRLYTAQTVLTHKVVYIK